MNELASVNRLLSRIVKARPGLEDGFSMILEDLRRSFRFSDVGKFNHAKILECYQTFEDWLNGIIVSQPLYGDITAVYFGMFDTDKGIGLYVIGSKMWKRDNPDWASRHDWFMDDKILWLPVYKDISMALSKHNFAGYYLAVALLTVMIQEYASSSVISLLDVKRRSLHIACGFDDGELYDIGELFEEGIAAPGGRRLF
jgi:hypothetical protein